MSQIESILAQFRTLPAIQKQQVIEMMIAESENIDIPVEVIETNRQRLADYDVGKVTAIPRKEAMASIRQSRLS